MCFAGCQGTERKIVFIYECVEIIDEINVAKKWQKEMKTESSEAPIKKGAAN